MTKLQLKSFLRFQIGTVLSIVAVCVAAHGNLRAQTPTPTPPPPSISRDIKISASLMDPQNVADIFGRRVSKRYVAVQLTIANSNPDFEFLIHDVLLGVKDIYLDPSLRPAVTYKPTSEDLRLVRGVAEKGQLYDKSNIILRVLKATGSVAAAVIGIASVGPSYAPTVAMFNGPVLTSYRDVFPDMTINQMNRLNDTAYTANTLVPKQGTKLLVAFLPQAVLMDSKYREKFWKDPLSIVHQIDFRNVETFVGGTFITTVAEARPAIKSIEISSDEMAKFKNDRPAVKGHIEGSFLDDSQLLLDEPSGIKLAVNGVPEENRITFTLNADSSIAPGTTLHFTVTKNGQKVSRVVEVTDRAQPPTLTSANKSEGAKGETVKITLTGSNFLPGGEATQVLLTPDERIDGDLALEVTSKNVKSSTAIEIGIRIAERAPSKDYEIRVVTPGGISNPQKFRVSTPASGNN
jgi:hypothetical protein